MLGILFEAPEKIRLMRLFLRNPLMTFTLDEVLRLSAVPKQRAERELGKFLKLNFITRRAASMVLSKVEKKGSARKIKLQEKKVTVYTANQSFEFLKSSAS